MKEKRMVSVLIPKDGFTGLIAQKTGRNKVCPCGSGKKAKIYITASDTET